LEVEYKILFIYLFMFSRTIVKKKLIMHTVLRKQNIIYKNIMIFLQFQKEYML